MRPSVLAVARLVVLASVAVAAGCGPPAAGSRTADATERLRLCAPLRTPAPVVARAWRIVASRVREGYGLKATVVLRRSSDCVLVRFRRPMVGVDMLAHMLAERGMFVQGVGVPASSTGPGVTGPWWGTRVRYTTDRVTRANRHLPLVRPIFGSSAVRRSSVRLDGLLVWFDLKPAAKRAWCRFTTSHSGKVSPSLFDRVVIDPLTVNGGTCMNVVTPLPPPNERSRPRFSPQGARALFAYLRFGPLPFEWRRVTVSS